LPQEISRLESFVIRLETDGSVWKRFQTDSGGLVRLFFFLNLNHKMKKRHGEIFGLRGENELAVILK
jgi:hypothetical protein